ncbi:hypothetical protein GCM10022381_17450 [Leifsonia kafniensis]|uniref:Gram-positive cocci surface proteins LPxTG domain-containing protein n=1 Tax=Leifsonia kafniensis TaxID=475957 RepID=A0ABP7KHQ4_9MICO
MQTPATVTFEMNGHGTQIAAQSLVIGDVAMAPGAPSASGFTFTGWYTDAEASQKFAFTTTLTGNITLYAGWTENTVLPVTSAIVTFEMNGHGTAIADQTVTIGQLATKPTAPTASGYTFTGWFTDAALSNAFGFSTAITADTTLYAGWDEIVVPPADAVVGFDMNGHGTQIPRQTVTVGEFATEPTEPTASGFAFTGWYTDADASNAFSFSTAITTATTLYAGWGENAVVPPTPTDTPTTDAPTTDTPATVTPSAPAVVKPTSTNTLASTGTANPTVPLLAALAAMGLGALLFARRRIRRS